MAKNKPKGISAFSAEPPSNELPKGNNYLFLIAVSQYEDTALNLKNCVNDAEALRSVFEEKYGFTTLEKLYDAAAKKEAIHSKLWNLLKPGAERLTENDTLVIFFSGHGDNIGNDGYWLPWNALRDDDSTYYSATALFEVFTKRLTPVRHILLIIDCCYSDRIFSEDARSSGDSGKGVKSRWVITAGRNEPVFDSKNDAPNSPFTTGLVNLLREQNEPIKLDWMLKPLMEAVGSEVFPRCEPVRAIGHEGGDCQLTPKDFNPKIPNPVKLREAVYALEFANEFAYKSSFDSTIHQFNLLVLRGRERSGHKMLAKKFIRYGISQNAIVRHLEHCEFAISTPLGLQELWAGLSKKLFGDQVKPPKEVVEILYKDRLKDRNLMIYISVDDTADTGNLDDTIRQFWADLQVDLKRLAADQEQQREFGLYFFIFDKRLKTLNSFTLPPGNWEKSFSLDVPLMPVPLPFFRKWWEGLTLPNLPALPNYNDFMNEDNRLAQTLIECICEKCGLAGREDSPVKQIFEKYDIA